jgi:hypothetical protein
MNQNEFSKFELISQIDNPINSRLVINKKINVILKDQIKKSI